MVSGAFGVGVAALAAAGVVLCWLGVRIGRRDARGAAGLAAFAGLAGVGAVALAGLAALRGPAALGVAPGVGSGAGSATGSMADTVGPWYRLLVTVALLGSLPWAAFGLRYTGHDRELRLTVRRIALAGVPVGLLVVGVWVDPVGSGVVGSRSVGLLALVAGVVLAAYWLVVHLLGTVTLVRTSVAHDHLGPEQGWALMLSALLPVVALTVATTAAVREATPSASLPPAPVTVGVVALGFWVAAAGLGVAVVRRDLLSSVPAAGTVARETLLDATDDLVVVVDDDERVVETNAAARRQLPEGGHGDPLSSVLGVELSTLRAGESVEVATADGRRQFDPQVTELADEAGEVVGRAVTLRDVTGREIRRQRLEVLNRVIRHNLRNKLTVVRGVADVAAEGDAPPEGLAEDLSDAARELMVLGEKAREIEELMHAGRTPRDVDLEGLVAELVAETERTFPTVRFESGVPPGTTVRADPELLRCAVSNVLEVAADTAADRADRDEAADGTGPTGETAGSDRSDRPGGANGTGDAADVGDPIGVTVRAGAGGADDGGPALVVEAPVPEADRRVIESGSESPLDHASGLGLWAANWCLTRVGGDLSFEADGDRIRLVLPAGEVPDPVVDDAVAANGAGGPATGERAASGVGSGPDGRSGVVESGTSVDDPGTNGAADGRESETGRRGVDADVGATAGDGTAEGRTGDSDADDPAGTAVTDD